MKLVQFIGLWTLAHHPSRESEWSLERKLRAIKIAGFSGVAATLDAAIGSLAEQNDLFAVGMIFPNLANEFPRMLSVQQEYGAKLINVQLGSHQTSAPNATKLWINLENQAAALGLEISLETHSDSVADSTEKVFQLADRYAQIMQKPLRFCWDFSQLGAGQPLRFRDQMDRILARSELVQCATQFLFRPFNQHHSQLPITARGELTSETVDYLEFVREIFRIWKRAPENAKRPLLACPSLGPKGGFALSTFPQIWSDAIVLAAEIEKRWRAA